MLKLVKGNRKSELPAGAFTKEHVFALRNQMHRQVCKMLRKHPNRELDVEDIVQDATIRAVRALPRFRGDSSLNAWVYRIVYRITLDYLRDNQRRPLAHTMALVEEAMPPVNHTEDKFIARVYWKQVLAIIYTLPPDQARALLQRLVQQLTFSEIAAAEGIPVSSAKTRYYHGLSKLRLQLRKFQICG